MLKGDMLWKAVHSRELLKEIKSAGQRVVG